MPLFRLIPFASDPLVSGLSLTGSVELAGSALRARYVLAGDLSAVVIPGPASAPERRDGLWRNTCFEIFCAPQQQARYLEVNASPSGDWNAYSFTSYREGMAPLSVAHFSSQCTRLNATELALHFELQLLADHAPGPHCDLGVTAVIEHSDGTRSYWALKHTGERPDFHRRDSFILPL